MASDQLPSSIDQLVTRAAKASARTTKPRKRKQTVGKVCRTVTRKVKVNGKVRRRKVKICQPRCRTVTKRVKVNGKVRRRKVKVCQPEPKRKTGAGSAPVLAVGGAGAGAGGGGGGGGGSNPVAISDQLPPAAVAPIPAPAPGGNVPAQPGRVLTAANVERLLWRAGFGPRRGEITAKTGMTIDAVVAELTDPTAITYRGTEPKIGGQPLKPGERWGDDHLHWLDRMVRCEQPLLERMALIWHDWFATNTSSSLMIGQIQMFRDKGLGRFDDLLSSVTTDPAMLTFLNGIDNTKWDPNENYAREVMELFTLGAGRGAYTETDIREVARALTGWRATWTGPDPTNFRFDESWHDQGQKTIFGKIGNFRWQDVVKFCVEHPLHASFFCAKLWSYFIPIAPDTATLSALMKVYIDSGRQIRPVVAAILKHPLLLDGPRLVKPPVVYNAGLLRALDRPLDTRDWAWLGEAAGQMTYDPPNVAGWDDDRWLDTATFRGRWEMANFALRDRIIAPWPSGGVPAGFTAPESPEQALDNALSVLDRPQLSDGERAILLDFARDAVPAGRPRWESYPLDASRQNALRVLIATSPEHHCC